MERAHEAQTPHKIRHSDLNGAVFPNLVTVLNELYVGVFMVRPE